jgi:hypothetical protein
MTTNMTILIACLCPWLLVLLAFYLYGRITAQLLRSLAQLSRDQSSLVSELVAHRTMADTGNYQLAANVLQHSDAHDHRQVPRIHVPEPVEEKLPLAPNQSPEFRMADDLLPEGPPEK